MMKALLLYPLLEPSFWSLPTGTRLLGARTQAPPLGLITVAALLPRDWALRLVDMNARELSEGDWNWADMVLLSAMFAQRGSALDLIREAKGRGKGVVAGGTYPSAVPRELLEAGADHVVQGEGEDAIPLLLDALSQGGKGVVMSQGERPDMVLSPVPRFDLLRFQDYQYLTIQTSRGCPFQCEFCDVVRMFGRRPRYKTPEQVLREMDALYGLGHRGTVFIADDNFIGNRSQALEILRGVTAWQRARGKPFGFFTQTSLNLGRDTEMIDAMTAANFSQVFIGIESPDPSALAVSRKGHNTRRDIATSVRSIKANGLTVMGSFIVGLDGESKRVDERICALIEEAAIPINMINLLRAPPGTDLWNRLQREGRLRHTGELSTEPCSLSLNFVPSRPIEEVQEEYVSIWDRTYEPSRFLARTYRYYLGMRPTRAAMARKRGEAAPSRASQGLPRRQRLQRRRAFLFLVWQQGIRRSCRLLFWQQLVGMLRRNPSRTVAYLLACAMGEDMMRLREQILRVPKAPSR